ncbi:MAG: translocation/assembly module TamB domain-containing protein [Sulfitobacter sp.]|nr:translocation/assembly module TamB domain-containing protein [Sulfitobacter sp.]
MGALGIILRAATFWVLCAVAALAQDGDKGFLTRTIQDALSGAGREVSIDGFEGLLSSSASFDRLTISDAEGIWLTIEDAELEWNRSALLRGRLEVERLTAARLDLPRLPIAEAELPDAEAAPFSLPELPVSIEIADLGIDEINLGAPLLGEEAQLRLSSRAIYTEDLIDLAINAERTDASRGTFEITANLERSDNVLDLSILLDEGPGGIVARLLTLPDQPSVELAVTGSGPLDDFATDVRIATDGQERLAGQITLGTQAPRGDSATPDRRIQANIGGDITALLAPRYRAFFGENVRLQLDALREGNGALEVSSFDLEARAAVLSGQVSLSTEMWPTFINVTGRIADPDGTPILLPGAEEGTTVEAVDLDIDYDVSEGNALLAEFDIRSLQTPAATIRQLGLGLEGTLEANPGSAGQFSGALAFDAKGLMLSDPALAEGVGTAIEGSAQIDFVEGNPIRISDLDLGGVGYGLDGDITIDSFETGFSTAFEIDVDARDLNRFSALAGRELDGQAQLELGGTVVPLSGQFDVTAEGRTQDVRLGIAQVDSLLEGETRLSLAALRNETGTFVRNLILENAAIEATADAQLRTDDSLVTANVRLADVGLVVPQYEGPVTIEATATQDAAGWRVDAVTDGPYDARITAKGPVTGENPAVDFTAIVPRIEEFVPGVEAVQGAIEAEGRLAQTEEGWRIETDVEGPYDSEVTLAGLLTPALDLNFDLSLPDVQPLVPQVSGPLNARGQLRQTEEGFVIDTTASGPYGVQAMVEGLATGPNMRLNFDLSLPDIAPLAPGFSGALEAQGFVRQTEQGLFVDTTASGPYGARAMVEGLATGPDMRLTFDLAVPDIAPLAPGYNGPLEAQGVVRQTDQGIFVDTTASGPYGARAMVEGLATGPDMRLTFDLAVPNVGPLVPSLPGALNAQGVVQQTPQGIAVDVNATGPLATRASVDGVVTGPNAAVDFTFDMVNVGAFVDELNGPLSVNGSARKAGDDWRLDTYARGPAGTQATIAGLVGTDGQLDISANGSAPLGLARPFLEPRNLQGQANFDLQIQGQPALSSVSGTITTSGATFTAPNLRLSLQNIDATVTLGRNRARIEASAQGGDGGALRAAGDITLTSSLPADLRVALDNLVLIDPRLYRTSLSGEVRLAGPLAGGARITGQINVGETEVSVPGTGLTSIGDIPAIRHINAPADVQRTRDRAGLEGNASRESASDSASGPGFGLDLTVNAPGRIFVRGRGLDAELGGQLRLTGTTNRIISAGRFDLLRGRLDILGKRFDLREGSVQFQGDLVPFIRFVTATDTANGEVRIIVQGPADSPEVLFEATPDAPQDEVLAQLLFGRSISEISAFQALQLANAVATLAGRGGTDVIGNLRDGFGLDDFDVTTTDEGETALRVGKYLSDNIYTDVTAASDGSGEVSLNLDITPNLKGKATLGSDGNTGIGIFFEKDY